MGLHVPREVGDSGLLAIQLAPAPSGLVGTAASGWTAVEQGAGTQRRTIIDLTSPLSVVTTPDTAALSDGVLCYTFPAGQIIVHEVYGDVGMEIDDATNVADTPEVGLGNVIVSGAIATLGASVTTTENVWGPHVVTGCDTGAAASDAIQQISVKNFIIPGADSHAIYFNVADTWSNGAGTADCFVFTARFVIDWSLLPIEGV